MIWNAREMRFRVLLSRLDDVVIGPAVRPDSRRRSGRLAVHDRFDAGRLARLAEIERWHFWFVGRRACVLPLVRRYFPEPGRDLLDVGCGTGLMVEMLTGLGHRVTGLDGRPEGLKATRNTEPSATVVRGDATRLPFPDGSFDGALLLDVLEHVDDEAALREVFRVLRPGGVALITVPALPWLWSVRDDAAGHLRRYTRPSLSALLKEGGLVARRPRYYQFFLFPLVAATRLLGRRTAAMRDMEERPAGLLNRVLTWVNVLDARLGTVVPWPWGSSLVAVGSRRA